MSKKRKDLVQIMKLLSLVTHIGILFIANVLIAIFLGKYADAFFKTGPFLTIAFILLGIIAGFYNVYKLILHELEKK